MNNNNHISNERLLNIIQVNNKNTKLNNQNDEEMINTNNIIQNNISPSFNIVRYIGEGIQGKLYLLNDNNNNKYICKKIPNIRPNSNKYNQIRFELDILKYLSSNKSVKPYINPCVNDYIESSNIYTIFPILDSIPLSRFKKHLDTVSFKNKQIIIKKIIKNILHGISNIHKLNIAHQNIDSDNILIAIKNNDIDIKFTEFGLGCGTYKIPKDDIYNIKNNNNLYKKCVLDNTHKLNKSDFDNLKHSNYLKKSILKDNWKIACMLINILFPNINIETDEYNKEFEDNYLHKINNAIKQSKYNTDILNYIEILLKYYVIPSKHRKNSKYIIDKIVLYEKYKDE